MRRVPFVLSTTCVGVALAIVACSVADVPAVVSDAGTDSANPPDGTIPDASIVDAADVQAPPDAAKDVVDEPTVWNCPQSATLLEPGTGGVIWGIAVDASYVYWTNQTSGKVLRRLIAGGPIEELANTMKTPNGVAVTADHVYWTDEFTGEIRSVALDGGSPDASALVAATGASPLGIAEHASVLYYSTGSGQAVMRVSIDGGALKGVAGGIGYGTGVASRPSESIIAYTSLSGIIGFAPLDGGSGVTVASAVGGLNGLAFDDTYYYAADYMPGVIRRVGRDGGAATPLASNLGYKVSGLAIDSQCVYWSAYDKGEIWWQHK